MKNAIITIVLVLAFLAPSAATIVACQTPDGMEALPNQVVGFRHGRLTYLVDVRFRQCFYWYNGEATRSINCNDKLLVEALRRIEKKPK